MPFKHCGIFVLSATSYEKKLLFYLLYTCKPDINSLEGQREEVLVQLQQIGFIGLYREAMVHIVYLAQTRTKRVFCSRNRSILKIVISCVAVQLSV